MAFHLNNISSSSSSSSTSSPVSLLDDDTTLYCEEEEEEGFWDDENYTPHLTTKVIIKGLSLSLSQNRTSPSLPSPTSTSTFAETPPSLPEHFLIDNEELLLSLLSKEKEEQQQTHHIHGRFSSTSSSSARREAVEWMLSVTSHYNFSTLTAILSVTYLDKFLSSTQTHLPENYIDNNTNTNPWLIQLLAVTCVSLAAKIEEIHVPLLLDLQVGEGTKYIFEAKTIQKMELLVLSTLQWKMNAVTPISFLDHFIFNLSLRLSSCSSIHLRRRCEQLLLSLLPDSRFVRYLPSVLATATIIHVLNELEQTSEEDIHDYRDQILLDISSKEDVKACYDLLIQVSSRNSSYYGSSQLMRTRSNPHKRRKYCHGFDSPPSPNGVIDATCFGSDSSSDDTSRHCFSSSSSSSVLLIGKDTHGQVLTRNTGGRALTVLADTLCWFCQDVHGCCYE